MFPVGPFVDRRYIELILPLAQKHRVGTVCFKTFGAGKLLGDTTGYNQPPKGPASRGKFSSGGSDGPAEPTLPRLSVAECLHYTLTLDPDVALLGLSFPKRTGRRACRRPILPARFRGSEYAETCRRAVEAIRGKGPCWWESTS